MALFLFTEKNLMKEVSCLYKQRKVDLVGLNALHISYIAVKPPTLLRK